MGKIMEGVWTIAPKPENNADTVNITAFIESALQDGFSQSFHTHNNWWQDYWSKSSVDIPDAVLSKQYYNEMYKLGSIARSGCISGFGADGKRNSIANYRKIGKRRNVAFGQTIRQTLQGNRRQEIE